MFAEVYILEVLSFEIYPNVTNSFPSVTHVETDRQRSITVVSTNAPPSRQTSPGHCLSPLNTFLRTPSIPCRWMQNLLAYDLLELSQRPHSCNGLSLRNKCWRTLSSDCSIFESISELYINRKSWVKDVIQDFSQKAVSLSWVMHTAQCVKLNTKMS